MTLSTSVPKQPSVLSNRVFCSFDLVSLHVTILSGNGPRGQGGKKPHNVPKSESHAILGLSEHS